MGMDDGGWNWSPSERFKPMQKSWACCFLHGTALGAWFVPLGSVLDQAGMHSIKPYAFAASAIAAIIPFVLRSDGRSLGPTTQGLAMGQFSRGRDGSLVALAIEQRASSWLVLLLIQIQSLFSSPTASLIGSIVFLAIDWNPSVRSDSILGDDWMDGWLLGGESLRNGHEPPCVLPQRSVWIVLACFTLRLPHHNSTLTQGHQLTLRERFGWDAIVLLRNHDHRVVFLTAAMVAVPFAAFYPYSPSQLKDLGFDRVASWMSIGQVSEVMALL